VSEVFLHDIRKGYPLGRLPPVDLIFADVPYGTGRKFADYPDTEREARAVIEEVVAGADSVLRPGGVIAVMSDHRLNYFVRARLEAHPQLRFFNEIIWSFSSGGAGKKRIPQKHATISVFSLEGGERTFNIVREPYARNYGTQPGFHPEGRMLTSVWSIPILSTTDSRRVNYATEKPPALLEQLLKVFTNEGDVVYDPCCGGGSTAFAARRLKRSFYGSDINPRAVDLTTQRFM
jgi:DNA modification methylase